MDAVIGCMDTSAAAEVIGNLDASAAVEVVAHLDYVPWLAMTVSKKSPTAPTEQTPKKPEYLIARVTYLGVRWDSVPFNF